jgi:hypothetical protein
MQVALGLYGHQPMKMPHLYLWNKNPRKLTRYHTCVPEVFLDDHPLWIQRCEWLLHQRAVYVLRLHNNLWVDERVFCVRVCPTVISGRRIYPRTRVSIQLQRQLLGWHRRYIVLGPVCYQTDWRLKDVVIFCRLFIDATCWSCACSCEAEVVVSAWRGCSPDGEDIWQWLKETYPQRWNGGGGIFKRFLSPAIYPMDFFCRNTWRRTFTQFFPWLLEICWQEFRQMWQLLMPKY